MLFDFTFVIGNLKSDEEVVDRAGTISEDESDWLTVPIGSQRERKTNGKFEGKGFEVDDWIDKLQKLSNSR